MSECICNECKNLKSVIDENGKAEEAICQFGYPSDKCNDCNDEECSETCCHYEPDEEKTPFTINCKGCGMELKKAFDDGSEGDVFCMECYLNNNCK